MKKTPHQRIMRAARCRVGVRLTAEEVQELSRDDAISTRAAVDDENEIERRNEERAQRRAERTIPEQP